MKYYELAPGTLSYEEAIKKGLVKKNELFKGASFDEFVMMRGRGDFKAKRTGEFRAPKKGEWYLSGAIAEAYRAPNDFSPSMCFKIVKLVLTKTTTVTTTEEVLE